MSGSLNLLLSSGGTTATYSVNASATSINEGQSVSFNISTTGVPSSQVLYWEVVSDTSANDFATGTIFNATFSRGTAANPYTFRTFTPTKNYMEAPEAAESMYVRVRLTNASGAVVATSPTVTINDVASTLSSNGQVEYTVPGTYTFVAPQTTTYCIVCVGAGGGGAIGDGGDGGGGGALSYLNGYNLTAGDNITVVVGAGGAGATLATGNATSNPANSGLNGGASYFGNTTLCYAGGGIGANTAANGRGAGGTGTVLSTAGTSRGTFAGGPGGYGTATDTFRFDVSPDPPSEYLPDAGGGGGAAGYTGIGGSGTATTTTGNTTPAATGTGGGGGGGGSNPDGTAGGGGGVGLQGAGATGANAGEGPYWNGVSWGGDGGSGGGGGGTSDIGYGGDGGSYGGGGGGVEWQEWVFATYGYDQGATAGTGGNGAVRIIWGSGRAFPSTNTADV